ncbi:hypothetical protein BC827DRAFT_1247854 [Russula dissimulans]|nr:hypothetical protein BC827DRAFT_1247854 [Russula dissimulans]
MAWNIRFDDHDGDRNSLSDRSGSSAALKLSADGGRIHRASVRAEDPSIVHGV